jgi:hypothetical protein
MEQCQKELDRLTTEPVNVGVCEEVMGVVLEPFNRKYAFFISEYVRYLALRVHIALTARRCA